MLRNLGTSRRRLRYGGAPSTRPQAEFGLALCVSSSALPVRPSSGTTGRDACRAPDRGLPPSLAIAEHGALMDQSGRDRWQLVASAPRPKTARTRRLVTVGDRWHPPEL